MRTLCKLVEKFRFYRHVINRLPKERYQKFNTSAKMAQSKFEYVKSFEIDDRLKPQNWIVLSLQCHQYEKLMVDHSLTRPNEEKLVQLFNDASKYVMNNFYEISFSYVYSGKIFFVFSKSSTLYQRRKFKLLGTVASFFSSFITHNWDNYFENTKLQFTPTVEGSAYLFPNDQLLRNYVVHQQLNCHKNNLFQTTLWSLINFAKYSHSDALEYLCNKSEGELNEILFSECNLNYNNEDLSYKKGTVLLRSKHLKKCIPNDSKSENSCIFYSHKDLHLDSFWEENLILSEKTCFSSKRIKFQLWEDDVKLQPHNWLVVRIDGKGFTKFCNTHNFAKPNDLRSLELMNKSAEEVMKVYPDLVLSYGDSDEYSFVFSRYRNSLKLTTNELITSVVSIFAGSYVSFWSSFFDIPLEYLPAFDSRAVFYPTNSTLRDYLSWRQADCHINNLYNTSFWLLIQKLNYTRQTSQERLSKTFSKDKRKLLSEELSVNYDDEDAIYRKGTVIYRSSNNTNINVEYCDIIGDDFWISRPYILGSEKGAQNIELE